jgi:hypothetical protein
MYHLIGLAFIAAAVVLATGCKCGEKSNENESARAMSPAATTQGQRVAGLEKGWELAPEATYMARQKSGTVTLTATGKNPTAGFETKLVQSMLRIWPPQYMLAQKKPEGMVAQVITPYEKSASFQASEPVGTVIVTDAGGRREVAVVQE